MALVAPVKQVALKQKKGYHLVQQTLRHPHRRVVSEPTVGTRGGSGITSTLPLKTSQTCLTSYPSQLWRQLPNIMGRINMGLVDEQENTWMLIHTHFHGDLYQQVYIDRSVTNDTWHALLSSLLGEDYRTLVPSLVSLQQRHSSLLKLGIRSDLFPPREFVRL